MLRLPKQDARKMWMQRRTNAEGDGTCVCVCVSVSSVCAFKHELLAMCKTIRNKTRNNRSLDKPNP